MKFILGGTDLLADIFLKSYIIRFAMVMAAFWHQQILRMAQGIAPHVNPIYISSITFDLPKDK
jgi:hypothetical protein